MSIEREIKKIPVDKIEVNQENIRAMTPEQFNLLCESIQDNGNVEPIVVAELPDGRYKIVNGNHRFMALRDVFGQKEVDCVVMGKMQAAVFVCKKCGFKTTDQIDVCPKCGSKDLDIIIEGDIDEVRFWQEAVRLNEIRGEYDMVALSKKLLELKEKVSHAVYRCEDCKTQWESDITETKCRKCGSSNLSLIRMPYTLDQLKRKLGFSGKTSVFDRLFSSVKKGLPENLRQELEKNKEKIETIEGLSDMIHEIFTKHGSTVNQHFVFFDFGGKEHLLVNCDGDLWSLITDITEEATATGADIRDMLKSRLRGDIDAGS